MTESTSPGETKQGLRLKMSLGVLTFGGSLVTTRLIGLVSLVLLGRLLTPEDFGVVAIAALATEAVNAALGRHFEVALIRLPDPGPKDVGSAFALSILWGATAAAIVASLAAPLAVFFESSEMRTTLLWLAIVPLVDGLRNPGFSLHERDMRFGPAATREVVSRLAVAVASIAVALVLHNYWAIVAGMLAYSVTRCVLSHALAPTCRPTLAHWRTFLPFSGWMSAASLTTYLNRKIDRAVVGSELGVADAGLYRVGDDLATMATSQIVWAISRVLYPGLRKKSADKATLRVAYFRAQGVILALLMPIGMVVALTAEEILRVVMGERWLGAAPILAVLAPLLALNGLTAGVSSIIYIRGEARTLFLRDACMLLLMVAALLAGARLGGFEGILAARGAVFLASIAVTLSIAAGATSSRWWRPIAEGWRSFAACAAMIAAVWWAEAGLPPMTDLASGMIRLAVSLAVGGASYACAHLALWRIVGAPNGPERDVIGLAEGALRALRDRASGGPQLGREQSP